MASAPVYSFVHATTEKVRQARVDRHNDGRSRPAYALTRAAWDHQPTVPILDNADAYARAQAAKKTSRKERGKPGAAMVRILIGHPPRFEADDAWSRDRILSWARDSTAWLESFVRRGSHCMGVVTRSDLHVDETRPHVHAGIYPLVTNKRGVGVKLSWERVHMTATGSTSARESLRRMQSEYYNVVGKRYGMVRGIPAKVSGAVRQEPDNVRGLRERARAAEERVEELRRTGRRERQGAAALQREVEARDARRALDKRREKNRELTRGAHGR